MGDRATFVFEQENGDHIYLYGHWAGYEMMDTLATAIEAARPRWTDETYATRIAISNIIGNEWNEETGWGISTYFCDSEHSVPIVNWKDQSVRLYSHSWDKPMNLNSTPKFAMGLDEFVNKFSKSLVA